MQSNCIPGAFRVLILVLLLGAVSCSTTRNPQAGQTATEQSKDQRTREKVADATQRAKERSQELGQKLDTAGERVQEKAQAVAQGVKEGWRRDKYPLNLNSAPESELSHLPGLTQDDAQRIVSHRPYRSSNDLVTGHILTEQQYRGLKDLVVAK